MVFILHNICDDSRVLSWAIGDDLNSAAREAEPSYHIWTALPVIFASLERLSSLPLCTAFLARPVVSCTVSQSWSSFLFGPSLFIVPRVCGRSIDPDWDCGKCFAWLLVTHALTACVRAGTMGPSLYQGQKINNSGSGQRQGGDVKCAALNVFTHGMLTGAE